MRHLRHRFPSLVSGLIGFALFLTGCSSPPSAFQPKAAPAVPMVTPPAGAPIRIVLVGDSTVTDKAGWGMGFKQFLADGTACLNTAAGGRSSKSFIDEGRWKTALALKGDYYLIQFGHNDEPGKGSSRETDPNTTYFTNMTRYVDEARAIGARPVLVTSLVRRSWEKGSTNKINSSLVPYVEAVKRLAAAKNVPLIELHARSQVLCEAWGRDRCVEFSPIQGSNKVDNTHLNEKGSVVFARLVIEDLMRVVPELKPCFRDEPRAGAVEIREFDVRQFGAVGDGKPFDTKDTLSGILVEKGASLIVETNAVVTGLDGAGQ